MISVADKYVTLVYNQLAVLYINNFTTPFHKYSVTSCHYLSQVDKNG